ncbi:hypothetical protein O9G_002610 [Rozella allomycis CSF55]|uniref:Uncharacterized protein n=1 Tax=Rozella allomycis (strain CSF55) TaxID=988480 RepID=A0A075ATU1_ROZAC|nr:hypothetical protein O9G_002610 [Rozella allomycis CSF55]|eukprot:EPZ32115.1 hypothetical protein O9G_002610 [Rozella allomycis CSF55]
MENVITRLVWQGDRRIKDQFETLRVEIEALEYLILQRDLELKGIDNLKKSDLKKVGREVIETAD